MTNIGKKTIAVDMDWVIADLTRKWLIYYNTIFNDNLEIKDLTTWGMNDHVIKGADGLMDNFLKLPNFYRDLDVIPFSQAVIEKMTLNYNIIIVTDPYFRSGETRDDIIRQKTEWLKEHFYFIPESNYVFTGDKSSIDAFMLIDDSPYHLESFLNGRDDRYGIVFDAPYNKDYNKHNTIRVSNWIEVEEVVNAIQWRGAND